MATAAATAYDLRGDLIEACSCMGPCPCWVGDDPDGGHCNSFTGYHVREGHARGVDLSGLSLVSLVQIPGNVAAGNWSEVLFVDAKATDEQYDALVDAFQGRLGGPLADLAALITDRRAQYRVPIEYTIEDGVGTVKVARPDGDGFAIDAVMEPYRGPDGQPTRLVNSSWSTIPGNEALVGKASHNTISVGEHGMEWAYEGRNSIQGLGFRLVHDGDHDEGGVRGGDHRSGRAGGGAVDAGRGGRCAARRGLRRDGAVRAADGDRACDGGRPRRTRRGARHGAAIHRRLPRLLRPGRGGDWRARAPHGRKGLGTRGGRGGARAAARAGGPR